MHHAPCTRRPYAPCTMHHAPFTMHHAPCTMHTCTHAPGALMRVRHSGRHTGIRVHTCARKRSHRPIPISSADPPASAVAGPAPSFVALAVAVVVVLLGRGAAPDLRTAGCAALVLPPPGTPLGSAARAPPLALPPLGLTCTGRSVHAPCAHAGSGAGPANGPKNTQCGAPRKHTRRPICALACMRLFCL